jgi:hypothetical protein
MCDPPAANIDKMFGGNQPNRLVVDTYEMGMRTWYIAIDQNENLIILLPV